MKFMPLGKALWAYWAELLDAAAIAVGWFLVTWGAAALLVPEVWPISAGLFLLSASGWGHVWTIAREGFYALTQGGKET